MNKEASSQKPRIGFVWESPSKSGERHIRRQILGSRAFSPVVLSRRGETGPPHLPVPVHNLSDGMALGVKLYRKYLLRAPRCLYNQEVDHLVALADELDLQLLHVFFGTEAIKYLLAFPLLNLPVTVSFHGVDVGDCARRPELSRHLEELFEVAAAILPRSEFMARELREMGCPGSKIWINRAGIPPDEFPYRERSRKAEEPATYIYAGRLIPKKGLPDTLAAFDLVRRRMPRARLWIAGEGTLRPKLEAEIRRRGQSECVRLLGFLETEELARRFHEADIFVHPSVTASSGDHEGIPNSLLEAMATGLPCITTRHAGIPEAVRDGDNGWLVEESNPGQLAERMLWCARNPEAAAAAGAAARRFVERRHLLADRMRMLDRKYASVIDMHRPVGRRCQSVRSILRRPDLATYRT